MLETHQVILVDTDVQARAVLAERLRMQGYAVVVAEDAADGARLALSNPPSAVIADLWMQGISGVQVCRLLKAEVATASVPVILRGPEGQRNRFWAEQAGAAEYVGKGRMGDLVRALARAIRLAPPSDGFFTELASDGADIRDRIAAHLDAALFESVMAAEVRALTLCGQFDRLFDLLSQFISRVTSYRWLALSTPLPLRFGLHSHPRARAKAEAAAREALGLGADATVVHVGDEDAYDDDDGPEPIIRSVRLGDAVIAQLAMAPRAAELGEGGQADRDPELITIVARELAGPIRMATLVEETQRLATVDPLTGLMNRRAFLAAFQSEITRSRRLGYPLSCLMFDVDHFKHINDRRGHASGDAVLSAIGKLMGRRVRTIDLAARWGGEEFFIVLTGTDDEGGRTAAENLRVAVETMEVPDPTKGDNIPVTASFGLVQVLPEDDIDSVLDRADHAMYQAKTQGRNRVVVVESPKEMKTAATVNVGTTTVTNTTRPGPPHRVISAA